ncbi:hypothetical protein D1820_15590 [Phaeobacter sp. LSS9]|uniref:hypothetical protein n=1 Tax=unclassified Phaeobacter TaxID=2621772 RepID=UPI000E51AE47|nr:hypothetical protein [Phaeobacter sp. LSS9]AXT36285.1 hypothetical protein D1820_15590 [Phaeobacter sp. LSS9]
MADKGLTTLPSAAKLEASDRVALQTANGLFEVALRADWKLHASRLSQDNAEGAELAHEAACAWASCTEALQELGLMTDVDDRIVIAARHLQAMLPPYMPEVSDIRTRSVTLLQDAKPMWKHDPELAETLQQTGCLLHVHAANLELMSVRKAA